MGVRRLGAVSALAFVLLVFGGVAAAPAGAAQPTTVVSLTFDDGDADQFAAAQVFSQYHVAGTFYIISGAVDTPGYLTRQQLRRLAAAGNEIGGHTVSHLDLTLVPSAEARRQVCESRATLTAWGYRVTSFAYPDGSYNPSVEAIAKACGYNSGRSAAGLRDGGCPDCVTAERQPPVDPYAIRTPNQVDSTWTLSTLQQAVLAVRQNGGGWLPLVFHHICADVDGCGDLATSTATLRAFVAWLVADGIPVRTVDQVMGGAVAPVVASAPAPAHGVVNGSLDTLGTSGGVDPAREAATAVADLPQCWMMGGYGTNDAVWRRVAGAHHGHWAEQVVITSYVNGDAKLLPQFDLGNCSIPVRAGTSYQLSIWYRSTASTQFAVYYRDQDGRWVYWTSSPYFSPAAHWTDAVWRTPAVPDGAGGLSFGLALFSVGSLITDDYSVRAAAPLTSGPHPLSLLTVPLLGAVVVLTGVYVQGARRSARRRRRGHQIARAARGASGMSSSNR